jgi:NADH:ubiquinone oxidoreductase subunit 3 (subunit A)
MGVIVMEVNQSKTVSLGEWIGTMLLLIIPVVNIVLIFVWAFGNSKPSKKHFFQAWLILALACIVLSAVFWAVATYVLGWTFQLTDFSGIFN